MLLIQFIPPKDECSLFILRKGLLAFLYRVRVQLFIGRNYYKIFRRGSINDGSSCSCPQLYNTIGHTILRKFHP